MGLLSGLMGLTSDVDVESVRSDLAPIMIDGEEIV
ncbi:MAG: cytoplasmic protein, partial [Fulvimarina sp.]|nr:cytoplasmic protein [Fulvimarina sp.]